MNETLASMKDPVDYNDSTLDQATSQKLVDFCSATMCSDLERVNAATIDVDMNDALAISPYEKPGRQKSVPVSSGGTPKAREPSDYIALVPEPMMQQPKVSQRNSKSKEKSLIQETDVQKDPETLAATPIEMREMLEDDTQQLRVPALSGMFGNHLAVEKDNKGDLLNQRINFSKLKSDLRDKLLFNDAEFKQRAQKVQSKLLAKFVPPSDKAANDYLEPPKNEGEFKHERSPSAQMSLENKS